VSIRLKSLPEELIWRNKPVFVEKISDDSFNIMAGPETDWFFDPADTYTKNNAPVGLFFPPDENFLLSAKVTVDFVSIYDAGVMFILVGEESWAKLCFEYSPQKEPMVVSVVTRGKSDDSNSASIDGNTLFLRVYKQANTFAFHYSIDRCYWHLVRYFSLGKPSHLQVGFSAQSPTGQGCRVQFSEIDYQSRILSDLRNGG
jgi:regulation of enolase protein 1 (concanavalin A-like superfamily)